MNCTIKKLLVIPMIFLVNLFTACIEEVKEKATIEQVALQVYKAAAPIKIDGKREENS